MSVINQKPVKMIHPKSSGQPKQGVDLFKSNLSCSEMDELPKVSAPIFYAEEQKFTPGGFEQLPLQVDSIKDEFPENFSTSSFFADKHDALTPCGFEQEPLSVASDAVSAKSQEKSHVENDRNINSFPYLHTQKLLDTYNFFRIDTQMYVYDSTFGIFKRLNCNQLKAIIRKDWNAETQILLSRFNVMDIMDRLQSDPYCEVPSDYFDINQNLVNFLNGTVDISNGEFHQHSIDFKQTSVLNAEYRPNLTLNGSLFENFIYHICGRNLIKVDHLQEVLGFMLSSYTKVKKAIIFDGVRDSSKSTLLRVIERIIGSQDVSHFTLAELSRRFVTGKLMDKKINICGERGSGLIKDIEVFKMITGGDWCESENKGQDFISRPAKTKLVFAGNFLPSFENEDDNSAFMERSTLFIFSNSVPKNERIINMDDLLFNERDLIVSWAMEGLRRLVQNNFAFSEAEDAALIRQSRNMQTNPVNDFLGENCLFKNGSRVFSTNLYSKYRIYCHENSLEGLCQKNFTSEVIAKTEGRGVIHKKLRIGKSKPLLGFENMCLINEMESESAEQEEQRNNP